MFRPKSVLSKLFNTAELPNACCFFLSLQLLLFFQIIFTLQIYTDSSPVLLCPGRGIEAENPKPVWKELGLAKESRDLRDERNSFDEIEKEVGGRRREGRAGCKEYISCLTRKMQDTLSTPLPFLYGGLREI